MKKVLIIALVSAFILILAGCASSPGDGTPRVNVSDQYWFVTREEGGMAARNNQINLLPNETFVYIYFRKGMPGANFERIMIDFVSENEIDIAWQAAYQPGAVWGGPIEIGTMSHGPIEGDPSEMKAPWYRFDESLEGLEKENMNGIVLRVHAGGTRGLFTVTDVQFIGLEK